MYKKESLNGLLEKYHYKNTDLTGKTVLLRSCLNVSVDEEGQITDDTRLREALPVIKDIAMRAKRLVVIGHLGRPGSQTGDFKLETDLIDKRFSLKNVSIWLTEKLAEEDSNLTIKLTRDLEEAKNSTHNILLLENIRFFQGEESKDENIRKSFAQKLAGIGDIFVNDSFPDYRKSASTYGIAQLLPSNLGTAFYKEVSALSRFNNPERPFVAILGGAKLSEKLDAMKALLEVADRVIVGGAMAYTLLKAQGFNIGSSLIEEDKIETAKEMLKNYGNKILLPVDHVIGERFQENQEVEITSSVSIADGFVGLDIGPETIQLFRKEISQAKSILINGPMGVFEWENTSAGTIEILKAVTENDHAFKLAGGGDSISAINEFRIKGFDHISTGGGAMLAFLAYDNFPTLDVIVERSNKAALNTIRRTILEL